MPTRYKMYDSQKPVEEARRQAEWLDTATKEIHDAFKTPAAQPGVAGPSQPQKLHPQTSPVLPNFDDSGLGLSSTFEGCDKPAASDIRTLPTSPAQYLPAHEPAAVIEQVFLADEDQEPIDDRQRLCIDPRLLQTPHRRHINVDALPKVGSSPPSFLIRVTSPSPSLPSLPPTPKKKKPASPPSGYFKPPPRMSLNLAADTTPRKKPSITRRITPRRAGLGSMSPHTPERWRRNTPHKSMLWAPRRCKGFLEVEGIEPIPIKLTLTPPSKSQKDKAAWMKEIMERRRKARAAKARTRAKGKDVDTSIESLGSVLARSDTVTTQ